MIAEEVKSFKDLIHEVQDRGFCGRCGGCYSFCSAEELDALELDKDGTPRFVDEERCIKCGICYLICPQIKVLNDELRERSGWQPPIGIYHALISARTTDENIRKVCTDGGVVTSLLVYALKKHYIDAAIVSKKIGPFARQPVIATSPAEVIDAAGSHFEETYHLEEVGRKYTTFSPTVREVKDLGKSRLKRIALVGTPCQIYTVRKMQLLSVLPADAITLIIGLFCMENFSFDKNAKKKLEKKLGIKLGNVIKLNIKSDVIATLDNGETINIPFELVDEVARPACFACDDFANDYADISCGGLGSPDGYTTTILRTLVGEMLYNGAKKEGLIKELHFKDNEELRIHKMKMLAKIVSFTKRKKKRAEKRLTS